MKTLDLKRLFIRTNEEKDGIIELKRGVKDIALPEGKKWARVSIPIIDGKHCIHGMAIYSDDLPDDIDVVYNINNYQPMNKVIRDFPPKLNIQGYHITPKDDSVIWVFDLSEELKMYSPTLQSYLLCNRRL